MRTILPAVAAVSLAVAVPGIAKAQGTTHIGPHVAYNFDAKNMGVGAQFSMPIARQLEFYPSFDYYFVSPGSLWALNADLKYRPALASSTDWLYVGAGLNLAHASVSGFSSTDAGLNLVAGAESRRAGNVHPYGELRFTLGNGSTAQIAVGLNFTLNRR